MVSSASVLGPFLAAALALPLGASPEEAPRCSSFDLSLAGIGSLEEELARTAGLTGSAPMWPGLVRRPSGARPLWLCDGPAPLREAIADPAPLPELRLDVVPPSALAKELSGWSDDRNDGALFAGRGLSASLAAGVRARWRWFTAQLAPLAAWQENRAFGAPAASFPGLSRWANPFNSGNIDLPLRMGPSDFWTFDLGQSLLRADLGPFALGISNENLWWGPGIRDALLMTNSGPGFPHAFLGTSRPVDIWIGWLEAEMVWGNLRPSRWFDGDTANRRLFEGVVYTFAPAFQRNLTLGFARVWVFPGTNVNRDVYLNPLLAPVLRSFTKTPDQNGQENQLASLFARWAFPAVQFELYGEWGQDDFSSSLVRLLMEYRHVQSWMLGVQKLFAAGRGWVRLQAETTLTFQLPHEPSGHVATFYTHGTDRHGYTHGGQMIGAGLGPQGDSHFFALDWFAGAGRAGLYLERLQRHERYYYDVVAPAQLANKEVIRHDMQLVLGLRGAWALREWDLGLELARTDRFYAFFQRQDASFDAAIRASWWPGRSEPPVLPPPAR